jgi:hypothetical protein
VGNCVVEVQRLENFLSVILMFIFVKYPVYIRIKKTSQ